MSTQNPPQSNTANGPIGIKLEHTQQLPTLNQQFQSIDWDSERQLISSLAKLQELESKIHELRSLLPDRLLAPLNPIVNPRRASSSTSPNSIPRNPQALSAALRKSAIEGVAEIQKFKELWNSDDMASIWHKVDEKLAETKGAFPQEGAAWGMWRVEYADLLRDMDEKEMKDGEKKKDGGGEVMEVDDEAHFPSSLYGSTEDTDPKKVIESFQARDIPGFRLASTRNESTIIVSLGLAGLTFEIQEALTTDTTTSSDGITSSSTNSANKTSLREWRVESRQHSKPAATAGASRLENAIVNQLNSRGRKWDLRFLLELILSYADIRSLPCKKCGRLTDSMAQLPLLRRAVPPSAAATAGGDGTNEGGGAAGTGREGIDWEGYHVGCI